MSRIRILKANEDHFVPVTNGAHHADIPVDGKFHEIHEELVAILADSAVVFELENADAPSGSAAAEGAAGLGCQAAPLFSHMHALAARLEHFGDALFELAAKAVR